MFYIYSLEVYSFIDFSKIELLIEEVQKMLITMIKKLNTKRYTLNAKPYTPNPNNQGQSLMEIIIAMSIGGILIGAGATAISLSLKSNYDTKIMQTAGLLSSEYADILSSIAESNWPSLYNPAGSKGPDSQFYLSPSGMSYLITAGSTSTIIESRTFTRYFSIENVNRDSCGIGNITTDAAGSCVSVGDAGVADDPSTQKIVIKVSWTGGGNFAKIIYLTRIRNLTFQQSDWSGGGNQENFSTSSVGAIINNKFSSSMNIDYSSSTGAITLSNISGGSGQATGTIDSTYKYAWSENIGWLNFGTTEGNVVVSNTELTGYAWNENSGWISLNCSNTNSCLTVDYKVSNDSNGNLSGYAWSENLGWINFGIFSSSTKISVSTGDFSGYAWNENTGWISFNCSNTNSCQTVDYKVKTNWRQ